MNELHDQFVSESRELVHQATEDLLGLEGEEYSEARVDRVFRAFHTLKGAAGLVNLPPMAVALHAAEDLLDSVRGRRLDITPGIIDAALACLDQVGAWVDAYDADEVLPPSASDDAAATARRLRALLGASASDAGVLAPLPAAATAEWMPRVVAAARLRIAAEKLDPTITLTAIAYDPAPDCFFLGDDPLGLMRRVPGLLALEIHPAVDWEPPAELNPYTCNLRFRAVSAAPLSELSEIFKLVPDQARLLPVAADPGRVGRESSAEAIRVARSIILEQHRLMQTGSRDIDGGVRLATAVRAAANAFRSVGRADLAGEVERRVAMGADEAAVSSGLVALSEQLSAAALADAGGDGGATASETLEVAKGGDRWLRVDERRVDALVNLGNELIVVKNSLGHLARQFAASPADEELTRALKRDHEAIDRLSSELRAAILELRMVSAAEAFRTFPRLVRDLAQRLGKNVSFVTRGESTRSDKAIINMLVEPLLHLVRNALDHGLETPEERRAAGKPETATLTLQASRVGDRFLIEVIDDGRGIDPAVIRKRAAEKGLMPADAIAALDDAQALDLIFHSGFTTSPEISDVSGRGVGMDIVRSAVERVGGHVSVSGRVGAGTTVSLSLPTSIALMRIMVVSADRQTFGIPMDMVHRTVTLAPERITRIRGVDSFVLDDRVVPIRSLAALMGLNEPPEEPSSRLVMVIEMGGLSAIEVDAVEEPFDGVVKPMQGVLANARGYAGTTLLGNGGVLLVLDLRDLLS